MHFSLLACLLFGSLLAAEEEIITVSATSSREVVPDRADMRVTLWVDAEQAALATRELAAQYALLASGLQSQEKIRLRIQHRDQGHHYRDEASPKQQLLQVAGVIDEDKGRQRHYSASMVVHISTPDLELLPAIHSALAPLHAVTGKQVVYRCSQHQSIYQELLAEAMAIARRKAAILATAGGVQVGLPRTITEQRPAHGWHANDYLAHNGPNASEGMITITASISVDFEHE